MANNKSIPQLNRNNSPKSTDLAYVLKRRVQGGFVDRKFSLETMKVFCNTSRTTRKSGNYTLLISDCDDRWFSNKGATGIVNFSLPPSSPGVKVCFFVESPVYLFITPSTGQSIDLLTAVGESVSSNVIGSSITIRGKANGWHVISKTGTWSVDTTTEPDVPLPPLNIDDISGGWLAYTSTTTQYDSLPSSWWDSTASQWISPSSFSGDAFTKRVYMNCGTSGLQRWYWGTDTELSYTGWFPSIKRDPTNGNRWQVTSGLFEYLYYYTNSDSSQEKTFNSTELTWYSFYGTSPLPTFPTVQTISWRENVTFVIGGATFVFTLMYLNEQGYPFYIGLQNGTSDNWVFMSYSQNNSRYIVVGSIM